MTTLRHLSIESGSAMFARAPANQRLALTISAALAVGALTATPFARAALPVLTGGVLAFGTATFITNLILALLLISRGNADADGASVQLGATYLFIGVIAAVLTATLPGAITAQTTPAQLGSAAWLWTIWHAGFGLGVIRYCSAVDRPVSPRVRRTVVIALAAAVSAGIATTTLADRLPPIFGDPALGLFSGRGQVLALALLIIDLTGLWLSTRLASGTPERVWLSVAMAASCVDVWLTAQCGGRFSLGWYLAKSASLATTLAVLASLLNDLVGIYRRVRASDTLLTDLANRDGLTGLANRRQFDLVFETESRRARRHDQAFALLLIDLDHFKRYNDRHGHRRGDQCLRRVAAIVAGSARRPGDLAARFAGEQFALLLPMTTLEGARHVAARLLQDLEAARLEHPDSETGFVTLSVGISCTECDPPGTLLGAADRALQRAKAGGRNRAVGSDGGVRRGSATDGVALPPGGIDKFARES